MAEEPAEMIRGVFDLSETTAAEVMTPRTEVVAVPITATVEEIADVFLDSGHSRLPVYEQTVDHIIGVVLARDFWRSRRDRREAGLRQILRPVPFVPETKDLEHLLREMQREGTHIVVVLDEYGGTAGVVTVEDVVEQIVGEIADEHEEQYAEIREEEGKIIVSGRALVWSLAFCPLVALGVYLGRYIIVRIDALLFDRIMTAILIFACSWLIVTAYL